MSERTVAARRPPTKRDDQREASRRRLLDAALEILAEQGYRGLTVAKVGDRAGVSRGMVNYHFTSKAGLVEAVVADIRESFIDLLRARLGYARMSGLEVVLAKLDQLFARLAEPEPGVRARALLVLLVEAVGSDDGVKGLMADHLSLVRSGVEEDIRRGISDGSIRPDVDVVAQAFLVESIARGVLLQHQLDSARTRLADIGRAAHEMLVLGLSPTRGDG
ncbi:TetR/AcrR family transcriptional regulator [Streptomyces sp. HUAS TT20]|uniref:TetR/AcrR family transcriptional regulator n=1 Tax=Streptomyces sp. HUAS TT20 TaxID=3447509 RepID=UPI0021D9BF60|nr:TetR/AcrR family transcriptional regulator [Streptomyces sp. HUAS 15-9]UXY25394.1 TetR/AcrR family transcriptional regulator [Streptomyces sp. HUAS 15-9]